MTNEEKAREISNNILGSLEYQCGAEEGAQKMAKWKDEQYTEEKRELLGLVKLIKVDETNQSIIEDLIGMLK